MVKNSAGVPVVQSPQDIEWHLLNIGVLSQNKLWGETEKQRQPYCTMTLIQSGGTSILVDPTRPPDEMPRYLDEARGLRPADVDIVFLTHFHSDHHRGLEALAERSAAAG